MRHLVTILLALLLVGVCAAAETPVGDEALFHAALIPEPHAGMPGQGRWVWEIRPSPMGKSREVRLTLAMVDRAKLWGRMSQGKELYLIHDGWSDPYGPEEKRGDILLPMPVTFVTVGRNRLHADEEVLLAGRYHLTLRLGYGDKGHGLEANPIVVDIPEGLECKDDAWTGLKFCQANVRRQSRWEFHIIDAEALSLGRPFEAEWREFHDGLVSGIPRQQAWEAARIEWVRLPEKAGDVTMVYSPWQAQVATPVEALKVDPLAGVEETPMAPRRFDPQEVFKDPVLGRALPGRYWVRGALCWTTPTPDGQGKHLHLARTASILVTLRSPDPVPPVDP